MASWSLNFTYEPRRCGRRLDVVRSLDKKEAIIIEKNEIEGTRLLFGILLMGSILLDYDGTMARWRQTKTCCIVHEFYSIHFSSLWVSFLFVRRKWWLNVFNCCADRARWSSSRGKSGRPHRRFFITYQCDDFANWLIVIKCSREEEPSLLLSLLSISNHLLILPSHFSSHCTLPLFFIPPLDHFWRKPICEAMACRGHRRRTSRIVSNCINVSCLQRLMLWFLHDL